MARSLKKRQGHGKRVAPRRNSLATRRKAATKNSGPRWSAGVTRDSNALDLDPGVFKQSRAKSIAQSLKRSAERSKRRKASPYRSALSMLLFYINRAGRSLSDERRRTLERAKDELRGLFGREAARQRGT
jgi:hypothetical protein